MIDYKKAMLEALEVAESATASGDVPVGAVVFNAEGQLAVSYTHLTLPTILRV